MVHSLIHSWYCELITTTDYNPRNECMAATAVLPSFCRLCSVNSCFVYFLRWKENVETFLIHADLWGFLVHVLGGVIDNSNIYAWQQLIAFSYATSKPWKCLKWTHHESILIIPEIMRADHRKTGPVRTCSSCVRTLNKLLWKHTT